MKKIDFNNSALTFARLQQLISPSLPIGAFTYSQGMEYAVEAGWISTADDLQSWLESLLHDGIQYVDLPIVLRLYNAVRDNKKDDFETYSQWLLASRETTELRQEETQRAKALQVVLKKIMPDEAWIDAPALRTCALAGFALACERWGVSEQYALQGHAWAWLENMVSVAIKLVPLGQSDGQRVLFVLSEQLDEVCATAQALTDDELGASSTAMAIASSLHETQYCRLFRS